MAALATKLQATKAAIVLMTQKQQQQQQQQSGGGGGGGGGGKSGPEECQLKNEEGLTTKMVDGTPWWWCLQHNNGKGMWVRHPPGDYEKWKQSKSSKERYVPPSDASGGGSANGGGSSITPPSGGGSNSGQLELGSELKQVLTSYGMSDSDADAIWNTTLARSKN